MQIQPGFNRFVTGFNVSDERSGVVHQVALLDQSLHGLLVMVWGVLGTGAGEVVLGPAPEPLDGHEVGAVGAVEDQFDAKFWRQFLNCFGSVRSKIIEKQDCTATSEMVLEFVQEVHKGASVDAALPGEVGYDPAGAVDGSGDRDGLEADLLFGQENGSRLSVKPNFWFDLTTSEDALVHVEDVLPALDGLQEPSEAHQSTLVLPAQLARGQADVHAGHPLLDAHFSVQLSQSWDRYLLIFELFLEVRLPLN